MNNDIKSKLAWLWTFVLFNMAYADILSLMDATSEIRKRLDGGVVMSSNELLMGAVLMETAIVMILLSRYLPWKICKWVNIAAATLNIFAVVTGGHGNYYMFFAAIEVLAMLYIVWISWSSNAEESK
jgi:hypothetical protein